MTARSRTRSLRSEAAGSKMEPLTQLTDEQWFLIKDLFPWKPPSVQGGRPKADPRACFEGILWVLRTGARWKDLPKCFPSKSTCWLRFKEWTEAGIFERAWARLLRRKDRRLRVDWSECFADGTFASAKKGVNASALHVAAREQRSCCLSTPREFPWPSTLKAPIETRSDSLNRCLRNASSANERSNA